MVRTHLYEILQSRYKGVGSLIVFYFVREYIKGVKFMKFLSLVGYVQNFIYTLVVFKFDP